MNHFEKFQEALEIEQKSENTFTLIPNTNYLLEIHRMEDI